MAAPRRTLNRATGSGAIRRSKIIRLPTSNAEPPMDGGAGCRSHAVLPRLHPPFPPAHCSSKSSARGKFRQNLALPSKILNFRWFCGIGRRKHGEIPQFGAKSSRFLDKNPRSGWAAGNCGGGAVSGPVIFNWRPMIYAQPGNLREARKSHIINCKCHQSFVIPTPAFHLTVSLCANLWFN